MRDLFSNEKDFRHRWVGSPVGNRLGLHTARVKLAELCAASRRRGALKPADRELDQRLRRDGILIIEGLLPPALFVDARAEFRAALAEQALRVPPPPPKAGFGAKRFNPSGFDRYDGGSLNRFMRLDDRYPALQRAFADDSHLASLLRSLCGTWVALERFLIYLLVHGPEPTRPDLQRQVHCDTFHETFKLWYFFDEVGLAQGPLMYAPGSHRNTAARLRWEQRCVNQHRSHSAAFRIDEAELLRLGWQAPVPVLTPPNSLVLADTRGFHCRSVAPAGTERPCIYANLRPRAFGLSRAAP